MLNGCWDDVWMLRQCCVDARVMLCGYWDNVVWMLE